MPVATNSTRLDVHLHLPQATIAKVLVTCVVVWAALKLWPEFVFILISLLLAVALQPLVARLERRGLARGTVIATMAIGLIASAVVLLGFVFTTLAEQIATLVKEFPTFRSRVETRLPADYPILREIVNQVFSLPSSPEVATQLKQPLAWGRSAVSAGMATFFTVVLTLYFLLDGKRAYAFLLAYVPRRHRDKMAETVEGVSDVVCAYVRGQVITSLLFGAFCAVTLTATRVPAALPLALLAALCDVIPVVGIIIATAPAALLALTVSPSTAAIVLGLYTVYHVVESYYIVPRVYGQRMRLSTLAVLLALVAGHTLQGLVGAVLVLPLVAAYPIIERIWLGRYLGSEVIKDHKALARAAETGNEQAVEAVLQGEKHPWEVPGGASASGWFPAADVSKNDATD